MKDSRDLSEDFVEKVIALNDEKRECIMDSNPTTFACELGIIKELNFICPDWCASFEVYNREIRPYIKSDDIAFMIKNVDMNYPYITPQIKGSNGTINIGEDLVVSYSFVNGSDQYNTTASFNEIGNPLFHGTPNRSHDTTSLVFENWRAQSSWSGHVADYHNHLGDFWLAATVSAIGSVGCYAVTEEYKNLGIDLEYNGITIYHLFHFLPIMVYRGLITEGKMLQSAKKLFILTNRSISEEILKRAVKILRLGKNWDNFT